MPVVEKVGQVETLCCHQLSPSKKRLLRKLTPHRNPESWLVINAIALIWSAVLFTQHVISTLNDDEKTYVELEYLIYNFALCFVWAIEVGFNIFDYTDTEDIGENSFLQQQQPSHTTASTSETVPLWIELAIALYFLIASVVVVRKEVHHQANGMVLDVVLNMLAYLYMVYRQFADWRKSNIGQIETISNGEIV